MFQKKKRLFSKEAIIILVIIIIFIFSSYFSLKYADFFEGMVYLQGVNGIMYYVLITVVAVVIAPVSTFPLLPIAVALWGSFWAATTSVIGWTIGGMIAFILAQWGGKRFVKKLFKTEQIKRMSKMIPKRNLFWSVVFLRSILPVDLLSYALGLFTEMNWWSYFFATLIGVAPFAYIFAYSVKLPINLQIIGGIGVFIFIVLSYRTIKKKAIKLTK
jgi:uncharacterized membrane protein YdjX (TVP38/TMEM64 family)